MKWGPHQRMNLFISCFVYFRERPKALRTQEASDSPISFCSRAKIKRSRNWHHISLSDLIHSTPSGFVLAIKNDNNRVILERRPRKKASESSGGKKRKINNFYDLLKCIANGTWRAVRIRKKKGNNFICDPGLEKMNDRARSVGGREKLFLLHFYSPRFYQNNKQKCFMVADALQNR